jgi:hypothetical protein
MNARGDLQLRLPLNKLGSGEYESADGSVRVRKVAQQEWAVLMCGQPIEVLGVREFTTLTEAHGKLADAADLIRERAVACG